MEENTQPHVENSELRQALSPIPGTLIGIVGRKQSGKDTLAKYLVEEHGFTRYAFADPIKDACKIIFGFSNEQSWGNEKEVVDPRWGITPRKVFQIFGTELFQFELPKHAPELADIGRTFWAYRFALWYEDFLSKNPDAKVVVTDVRFPFESDLIKSLNGAIVKITRPNLVYNDTHASETEMDTIPYDFLIDNNTTIDDLNLKTETMLSKIMV